MSIYERGNTLWCRFTTPGGERIRRSCETSDRKAAEQFEAALKLEYWKINKLGEKPDPFWSELAAKWIGEKSENRSIKTDVSRLVILDPYMSGLRASQITRERVKQIIDRLALDRIEAQAAQQGRVKPPKPLSPATLNHYADVIRRVLNVARDEWELIDSTPKLRRLKVSNKRRRVESPDKVAEIVSVISREHLKDIVTMAAMTGLRLSALLSIELKWIDWERKAILMPARVMKADIDLPIPLNKTVWEIVRRRVGSHATHLFSYRGKPIGELNEESFYRVCRKVGVEDFHLHDLRRSFATWLGSLGVPDRHIKALGGWQQEDRGSAMFRYVWAELETLRAAVELLDGLWNDAVKRSADEEKAGSSCDDPAQEGSACGTKLAQSCGIS